MSKYVLGLDVGIASVGWGIVDYETGEIVDCGARLFPERDKDNNADRRAHRSTRRLIRRRVHRLERMKNLLIENKIIDSSFIPLENPYEVRVRGLKERLSNEELATAILHITKRRGVTGEWTVQDDEKASKDDEKSKGVLSSNAQELRKGLYISEIQLDRLKSNGKVRGTENVFATDDYINELKQILSNQKISKDVENEIISLVSDRREYYDGPGNSKSVSEYGRFYFDENGKVCEGNMIDKMRGRCSIYPDEFRAPKYSYSACLFNLLNDLNNMTINGESIDVETKNEIINNYVKVKGEIKIKDLMKLLEVDNLNNSGCRINEKGEPIVTEFKRYKEMISKVNSLGFNKKIYEDTDLFDEIAIILTSFKGLKERKEKLSKIFEFTNDELEFLSKLSGYSEFHNLSLKAIREFNKELLETNLNQMQIMKEKGLLVSDKKYKGLKNIPFDDELILSATARRSELEALKVVNAVRNKYGELDSVVIEMAREKNSKEAKANLAKLQKENKEKHEMVEQELKGIKVNDQTRLKVQLYLEQNCKTAYNQEKIDLKKLINDPYAYEIDHIIPISVSLNDSQNNKVLVTHKENQDKGKKSPYEYFKSGKASISYEEFKTVVLSNENYKGRYGRNKKANLLFEGDTSSLDTQKRFINRNLVDTRYSTRSLLNMLQDYYKDNEIDTKVFTINGSITNMFRKKTDLQKDRDKDSSHHAYDALIIAGLGKVNFFKQLMNISIKDGIMFDKETGEVIELDNEGDFFDSRFIKFISNIKKVAPKYSYKIDSKVNKEISDETIYGTITIDGVEYTIGKYKDIYGKNGIKLAKDIKENETKLLSYYNDNGKHSVHQLLKQIVDEYPGDDEFNPFEAYMREHGKIRKYSKNGDGPIINDVKYINKLGDSVIYLDKNYNPGKNRHVVKKQLTPYRNDIYLASDGTYKQLLIYQYNISFKDGKYFISEDTYDSLKEKYDIEKDDKFVMSLYKESIIEVDGQIIRYAGCMNKGTIYYKTNGDYKIYKDDKENKQPYMIIRNAKNIIKYNVDILGNKYIAHDTCKLKIDMI